MQFGAGSAVNYRRRPAGFCDRFVSQRHDVLHAGAWRRACRVRDWRAPWWSRRRASVSVFWRPSSGICRSSTALSRSARWTFPCWIPARALRPRPANCFAATATKAGGRRCATSERLGAVVRRIDGEPSLLSGSGVFPLAARQPILDRVAHRDSGYLRAAQGRHRRRCERQAELTFAIARHAVVDLSQVFGTPPSALPQDRLPAEDLRRIRDTLAQHGMQIARRRRSRSETHGASQHV